MSSILRALRRVEEDRGEASPGGLHEAVIAPSPDGSDRPEHQARIPARLREAGPVLQIAGLVLLAALLVAAFAWSRWGSPEYREPAPRTPLAAVPPTAPVSPDPMDAALPDALVARSSPRLPEVVPPAAPPPPPAPETPAAAAPEPAAVVALRAGDPPARREPPSLPAPEPVERPPSSMEPSRAEVSPPAPALAVAEPAAPPREAEPPRVAVAEPAARSIEEVAPPAPVAEPVVAVAPPPPAPDPAPDFAVVRRTPPPKVVVERTVWHPRPERRVAHLVVPGQPDRLVLREGDAVGGYLVKRIEPSTVVFTRAGKTFRRRVGERP